MKRTNDAEEQLETEEEEEEDDGDGRKYARNLRKVQEKHNTAGKQMQGGYSREQGMAFVSAQMVRGQRQRAY